jgi:predicted enzyme related to lactoylglutathione lyase
MFLENLVFDAVDPRRLGRFWEAAVGATTLTDNEHGYETRLELAGGPTLDLCFQPVARPTTSHPRLHLDLHGGPDQQAVVDRLLALGAVPCDIGQGEVPWVVLADPEGMPFCVMEERAAYRDTGPVAAVPVLGDNPERDGRFWADLTGWQVAPVVHDGSAPVSLRHPSGRGLVLEFFATDEPKAGKNRLHLDLRLEPGDDRDALFERVQDAGARRLEHDWGELPWTSFLDPSGNEFCVLPAPAA